MTTPTSGKQDQNPTELPCVTPSSEAIRATVRNDVLEEAARAARHSTEGWNDHLMHEGANMAAEAVLALKSSAGAGEQPVAHDNAFENARQQFLDFLACANLYNAGEGEANAWMSRDTLNLDTLAKSLGFKCATDAMNQIDAAPASTKEPASQPLCPTCKGDDWGRACAYPSEGKPGCLRDARLAADTAPAKEPIEVELERLWNESDNAMRVLRRHFERSRSAALSPVLQDERKAFEAWASNLGWCEYDIADVADGRYRHTGLEDAWEVWQAARASSAAQIQEQTHVPAEAGSQNGPDAGLKGDVCAKCGYEAPPGMRIIKCWTRHNETESGLHTTVSADKGKP